MPTGTALEMKEDEIKDKKNDMKSASELNQI